MDIRFRNTFAGDRIGVFDADRLFPNSLRLGSRAGHELRHPTEITLSPRPREVRDSSRSQWVWETDVTIDMQNARNFTFCKIINITTVCNSYVFLHSELNSMSIARKTCTAYDILLTGQREIHGRVILASDRNDPINTPQYIGSVQNVDGIALKLEQKILERPPSYMSKINQD